jgi:hypothetical protein
MFFLRKYSRRAEEELAVTIHKSFKTSLLGLFHNAKPI